MPGSPWFLGLRLLIAACALGGAVLGGVYAQPPAAAPFDAAPTPPDLPLAEVYEPGAIELGDYWVSEKLDGVRAYWDGERLFSRGGHRIRAPDGFTTAFPPVPLDGELWLGRGRFAEMSGLARRQTASPAAWRDVRYMVFDLPPGEGYVDADFSTRLGRLRELVAEAGSPHLVLVAQARIDDHEGLMTRLHAVVAAGGEGLMLRRDAAPYRGGRSDDLLKVKPYLDAEARVIGHLPGRGKYQGMLGALLVEEADGTRFRLGTGFTDAERAEPPAIGSLVTFKYHGRTKNGLPRFASFLRIREDP
jgi:DNA ligase-1